MSSTDGAGETIARSFTPNRAPSGGRVRRLRSSSAAASGTVPRTTSAGCELTDNSTPAKRPSRARTAAVRSRKALACSTPRCCDAAGPNTRARANAAAPATKMIRRRRHIRFPRARRYTRRRHSPRPTPGVPAEGDADSGAAPSVAVGPRLDLAGEPLATRRGAFDPVEQPDPAAKVVDSTEGAQAFEQVLERSAQRRVGLDVARPGPVDPGHASDGSKAARVPERDSGASPARSGARVPGV